MSQDKNNGGVNRNSEAKRVGGWNCSTGKAFKRLSSNANGGRAEEGAKTKVWRGRRERVWVGKRCRTGPQLRYYELVRCACNSGLLEQQWRGFAGAIYPFDE